VVLRLGIAECEAALNGINLAECVSRGDEIKGTVGGDAAPHRIGKELRGAMVVAAIEGDAALLVRCQPEVHEMP